jgi:hypothetical protein
MKGFEPITSPGTQKVTGQKQYIYEVLGAMNDKRYAEMAENLVKMGDDPTPGQLMQQQAYNVMFEVTSNITRSIADATTESSKTLARKG